MLEATYKVTLEVAEHETSYPVMKSDMNYARKATVLYYLKEMIENHFKHFNPNMVYPHNTIKYEDWKRKYYGRLPQLVLSGYLAKQVKKGRVVNGKAVFDLPDYGLYQIHVHHRNFLNPTKAEIERLKFKFLEELFYRRYSRISKLQKIQINRSRR